MTAAQAADADKYFQQLAENLRIYQLPLKNGTYRKATADEFMLMDVWDGRVHFKHRNTRNYVSQSLLGEGFATHGNDYDGGVYAMSEEEFAAAFGR